MQKKLLYNMVAVHSFFLHAEFYLKLVEQNNQLPDICMSNRLFLEKKMVVSIKSLSNKLFNFNSKISIWN